MATLATSNNSSSKGASTSEKRGEYKLGRILGSGGFGTVYVGTHAQTHVEIAIKVFKDQEVALPGLTERQVYEILGDGPGVPQVHASGDDFIALDLLGPSLKRVFTGCNEEFSSSTVVAIAEQVITCLEYVHGKSIIHGDVKPDNILIGRGCYSARIFLADFGMAVESQRAEGGVALLGEVGFRGTCTWASIRSHEGLNQCERDDLESLGYTVSYLFMGFLPWTGVEAHSPGEHEVLADMKRTFLRNKDLENQVVSSRKFATCAETYLHMRNPFADYQGSMPAEVFSYLRYCRRLQSNDQPDYNELRCMFMDIGFSEGLDFSWVPEWATPSNWTDGLEEEESQISSWLPSQDLEVASDDGWSD